MNDQVCPACKSANDERAVYCNQCGQPLSAPELKAAGEDGGCPARGGVVEDRGGGHGVCASCGLELAETHEDAPLGKAPEDAAERLTAAILRYARSGMPVDQAVASACRDLYADPAAPAEEAAGEASPCPLCGAANAGEAQKCGGCGIWFSRPRTPQDCPRCERPAAPGGKCECGAILTLPALLEYIEPSVRFVCSKCRQPYAAFQSKCPDCGGALISAERIKAYAATR